MLVFKASQIVSITPVESRDYDMTAKGGPKGVSHSATITAIGASGRVAVIKVKGKSPAEASAKLAALKLVQGKPAEFEVISADSNGGVDQMTAK